MEFTVSEIIDNIFHLTFKTRFDLASTFLRFQEHYESPKFANTIFTLNEFKDWYIKTAGTGLVAGQSKSFTYYEDWDGFNIPSWVLTPFYEGKFNPLSEKEQTLLEAFKNKQNQFYIIGTHKNDSLTLKHEIAHGMFYTLPEYKKEVLRALCCLESDTQDKIRAYLSTAYHENSLEDEMHAYTLEGLDCFEDEGITGEDINKASIELNKIFNRYRNK
jgi:hypothetical protein